MEVLRISTFLMHKQQERWKVSRSKAGLTDSLWMEDYVRELVHKRHLNRQLYASRSVTAPVQTMAYDTARLTTDMHSMSHCRQ